MLDGLSVVAAVKRCGITDVVWIPDSELGRWQDALLEASDEVRLIRVCREGEAIAVAAGLLLGGRAPIVLIQCTGLFEAGDSLRNFVHDLGLPIFLVVGVRSWYALREGKTRDTCPVFTEPIVQAWRIPSVLLTKDNTADDLATAYREAQREGQARIVLLAE